MQQANQQQRGREPVCVLFALGSSTFFTSTPHQPVPEIGPGSRREEKVQQHTACRCSKKASKAMPPMLRMYETDEWSRYDKCMLHTTEKEHH